MNISTSELSDGKIVVKVNTNLDNYTTAIEFKNILEEMYKEDKKEVVLDLDMVEKINSFGTGKILMFYRRFKKAGGELYFKSPLKGEVKDTFEELKLDRLLKAFS